MDTSIFAALITAAATVLAATITLLPWLLRREQSTGASGSASSEPNVANRARCRTVYYQGKPHRFLNFGGKNCRIEPLEDGDSFLAATHELFHDPEQTRRITRESIVV